MSAFRVLFREFFGQFFSSEAVTSDIRLRQAIIAVLAFLLTPGMLLSVQMFPVYEYARFRAPEMILPMTRMLATLFLTYSMMSIGLIGALVWDSLSFDRRDAMVLGPLPISPWTVVRAKLAAMGALLVGTCLCFNLISGTLFALVANAPPSGPGRHLLAHFITTSYAALFVFSVMVILRTTLGMLTRGHTAAALGSILQFVFISAMLGFFMLAPAAADVAPRGRGTGATLRLVGLPAWLPSHYFLAMYEQLRGRADADMVALGRRTAIVTLMLAVSAALLTTMGYRRQFQLALSSAASPGPIGGARIARTLARALSGANRIAHASSDFILMTIARSRAQQTPLAINGALGLGLLIFKLVTSPGHFASTLREPVLLLSIPLMLVFWVSIGMRAAFFVPSELPAAWAFRSSAPACTNAFALGTRAAMVAVIGPPAVVAAIATGGVVGGPSAAIGHAVFVLLLTAALADFVALTIRHLPFTRAYEPGHAKLKSRWPLYLLGANGFTTGMVNLELYAWNAPNGQAILLLSTVAVVGIFEWAIRRSGRDWTVDAMDASDEDPSSITVLDLGTATPKSA